MSRIASATSRRQVDDVVEVAAERVGAHHPQAHPELERLEAAGRLQALVDLVGVGRVLRVEVVGVPRDVPERGSVAHDEGAARDRLEPGLVVVDRRPSRPARCRPASRGDGARSAGRRRTPRRRGTRPRGPGPGRRSPGAGRWRRSRWCRPWPRSPSGPRRGRRTSASARDECLRVHPVLLVDRHTDDGVLAEARAAGPPSGPRSGRRRWRRSVACRGVPTSGRARAAGPAGWTACRRW